MKRLYLKGLNFLEKWYNTILYNLFGGKGVVLVFHEVSNDFEKDESCQIRVDTFKTIIERIASKYKMVSVDQFLAKGEKGGAVVTFDDVSYSFFTEVSSFRISLRPDSSSAPSFSSFPSSSLSSSLIFRDASRTSFICICTLRSAFWMSSGAMNALS